MKKREAIKVKVFQVFRNSFDADGNLLPREQRTSKIFCIGTVLLPIINEDSEENIWHLFNWTCWRERDRRKAIKRGFRYHGIRFLPNSNARGYCNSDIFFNMGGAWHVAEHSGWSSFASYAEAAERCMALQRF